MLQLGQNNFRYSSENPVPLKKKSLVKKITSKSSGRWTKEEHQRFVDGLKKFGKNWKHIEEYVGTRNGAQVRSHAQKFFNRLGKDFDGKFKDDDLQSENKLKEIFRKTSGSSLDTACSYPGAGNQDSKSSQASPTEMSPITTEMLSNDFKSPDSTKLVLVTDLFSKSIDYSDKGSLSEKGSSKEGSDSLKVASLPLFSLIMLKLKTCNNEIIFPKLSDIVNTSTGLKADENIDVPELSDKNPLFESSFKLYKKFSLENDFAIRNKINKLRNINTLDTFDSDLPQKKVKIN